MTDDTLLAIGANDEARDLALAQLREAHRDLDMAVTALEADPLGDRLALRRLKKKKLLLRDQIAWLEDQMNPDIIA